jgi:hypothetical protein
LYRFKGGNNALDRSEYILEDIQEFQNAREERIYKNMQDISPEYNSESNFINTILQDIRSKIPAEEFKKLNQLNSAQNHMEVISNSLFYKKGFCDGVKVVAGILAK